MPPQFLTAREIYKIWELTGQSLRAHITTRHIVALVDAFHALERTGQAARTKRSWASMNATDSSTAVASTASSPATHHRKEWMSILQAVAQRAGPSALHAAFRDIADVVYSRAATNHPTSSSPPSSPCPAPRHTAATSSPRQDSSPSRSNDVSPQPDIVWTRALEPDSPSSPLPSEPSAVDGDASQADPWLACAVQVLVLVAQRSPFSMARRLQLCQVCRRLRHALLRIPSLWTQIRGPVDADEASFAFVVALSQDLPLDVDLFDAKFRVYPREVTLWQQLALNASRLRSLSIRTQLEIDSMRLRALTYAQAPCLQELRLSYLGGAASLPPGCLVGHEVRFLECGMDQLAKGAQFPRVQYLTALAPDERDGEARSCYTAERIVSAFPNLVELVLHSWLEDFWWKSLQRPPLRTLVIEETADSLLHDKKIKHTLNVLNTRSMHEVDITLPPIAALDQLRSEVASSVTKVVWRPSADGEAGKAVYYLETTDVGARWDRYRWMRGVPRETMWHELRCLHRFPCMAYLGIPNDLASSQVWQLYQSRPTSLRTLELFFREHARPEGCTVLTCAKGEFNLFWALPAIFDTLLLTGIGNATVSADELIVFVRNLGLASRKMSIKLLNLEFAGGRDTDDVATLKTMAHVTYL